MLFRVNEFLFKVEFVIIKYVLLSVFFIFIVKVD